MTAALDPVSLLTAMLRIPSVSGREAPLVTALVPRLNEAGFRARRDPAGNLIAELGDGPRTNVLLGHIDTVPGEIPVRLEDGFLWGRGAVDAKGPLAAFLAAAHRLGPVEGHRLVVIGAVEEEAPSSKGAWAVRELYRPENTVIGEPSGASGLTLGYKGRLFARFAFAESKRHSSIPAPTPAEHAVGLLEAAREHARGLAPEEGVFRSLQVSLDAIETADLPFESRVRARLGFRLPPGFDVEALKARLGRALPPGGSLTFEGEVAGFEAPKSTPVVRSFLAAMREEGLEPRFKRKTGTADMNVVGPAWGPSILAYGPGDASLDHAPDERISLVEYERAIRVLVGALGRLVATVPAPSL